MLRRSRSSIITPVIDRRTTLTGLAAASLAGCKPRTQSRLHRVRLQFGWVPNVEYAGEWVAFDQHLFERQGVLVEWFPGGPNALATSIMLAAGEAELGYVSWLPFLEAVARGNDQVLIAAVFPRNALGIISLARHPVARASDLLDARILTPGPPEAIAVNATLAMAGLPQRWTQLAAGFSPQPLLDGDGDAYIGFDTNQTLILERQGLVRNRDFFFSAFDDIGFRSYAALLATTREMLVHRRRDLIAYLRGLMTGWALNARQPTLAPRLAVERYGADLGLDPAQQLGQNLMQIPLTRYPDHPGRPRLALDRALMEGPMYAGARAAGHKALPPVDRLADFSIVYEAAAGLPREYL
jgi:ABC-type nitrate/sulfonate/bicarbonate transport system substrate-binding protein